MRASVALDRPGDWLAYVNEPVAGAEMTDLRRCASRGSPYGDKSWVEKMAGQLGLASTLRPRGRPSKEEGTAAYAEKGPDPFFS